MRAACDMGERGGSVASHNSRASNYAYFRREHLSTNFARCLLRKGLWCSFDAIQGCNFDFWMSGGSAIKKTLCNGVPRNAREACRLRAGC